VGGFIAGSSCALVIGILHDHGDTYEHALELILRPPREGDRSGLRRTQVAMTADADRPSDTRQLRE
jgi:hypothetical protein